jgi:thioredoxin 1
MVVVLLGSVAACKPHVPTGPSAGEQLVQNATASGLPTVAEFGAATCASCREMKIVLDGVASRTEGRAHVLIVDISKDFRAAKTYSIQMMPTQIFFGPDGREIWRHMGPLTEGQVLERLGLGQ